MVDRRRLLDILSSLNNSLDDLERYRSTTTLEGLQHDRDRRNMVLHALFESIQAGIDVASVFVAEHRLPRPETYRDAFQLLENAGLLDDDLAQGLADLAGFRNVIVHAYMRLDLTLVHRALQEKSRFLFEFARWIADKVE